MRSEEDVAVPRLLVLIGAWSWRLLIGVAAGYAAVFVLRQLYVVVLPVVLALFLAAVLEPAAAWLRARGWHPILASTAVFVASLVVFVALVAWLGTAVAGQFGDVGDQVSEGVEEIKEWATGDPLNFSQARVDRIDEEVRSLFTTGGEGSVSGRLAGPARAATEFVGGLVLLLFTLFFVLKDGQRIGKWALERTPPAYTRDVTAITEQVRLVARHYLAATAATGFIDAILIGVALWAIGVPLILPLAVLTFLGGFFPLIGATAAGAVASLVALVSNGIGDALLVVAATVFVQQFEGNVLQPVILERAIRLHPLVTTWSVAGGLIIGGLAGAFLAVPLVAIVAKIVHYYRTRDLGPAALASEQPFNLTR